MIKRFLAISIMVLVMAFVVSCAQDAPAPAADAPAAPAPAAPAPQAAEAPVAEAADEITELVFWHIQTHELRAPILQDAVDRFMASNPNYNVNVVTIMNDVYKQQLIIAMAANELPDIFMSWTGGPMIEYINAGHLFDMTDLVNATDIPDRLLEAGLAQGTHNDRIYGLPAEGVAIAVVFYNRTMFADLGIEVPTTIAELEQVAETLIANGIIPFALANHNRWTGSMYYMNLATRIGGLEPFKGAVSGEGSFHHDSFVLAGNTIQDWVNRGFFAPGFNGLDEDIGQSRQLMYAGLAGMHVIGNWFVSQVLSENPDFYEHVGVFQFPAWENSPANQNIVIGTVGDNFYHIASTSASPEGAFRLLTYVVDDVAMMQRLAAGAIPPIVGVADLLEDPLLQEIMRIVQNAPAVQLWYDQYLPPFVGQAHLNSLQEVFGLTMTPEEANAAKQEAVEAYRAGN